MAKLLWGILCNRIITDQETNTTSYIDAVEVINVTRLPLGLPGLALGLLFRREKEGEELHLRFPLILNNEPAQFFSPPVDGVLEAERLRVNLNFGGITITEPGSIEFLVEQKNSDGRWLRVYDISLDVRLLDLGETEAQEKPKPKRKPKKSSEK